MIRRSTKLQLLAFLLVTVVGVSYTAVRYVGIGAEYFGRFYHVYAVFADSGGIFENAEVTYRGVHLGRVESLQLTDTGVKVKLRIEADYKVPENTRAVVRHRSAVGEQYIDLRPANRSGPYLTAGDVIPDSRTGSPVDVTSLLLNLDQLVRSLPKDDLKTVLDELDKAFSGTGPQLARIVENTNKLVASAQDTLPETVRLIEDGKTVLDTQRASSQAILSFARDLRKLSEQVKDSDSDIRAVIDHGAPAARQLNDLLTTVRPDLPILLSNLTTTGQILTAHLPGLEQMLVTYPLIVAASYTVVPGDGTAHFGLVLNNHAPPPCVNGYEDTRRRYPQNTADSPANTDAGCVNPKYPGTSARGSRTAPGMGRDSTPDNATNPNGQPPSATTSRPGSQGRASVPYVAGYDPLTGSVTGPGGQQYTLGSRGGQKKVLGEDSWKWLLVGPLAR